MQTTIALIGIDPKSENISRSDILLNKWFKLTDRVNGLGFSPGVSASTLKECRMFQMKISWPSTFMPLSTGKIFIKKEFFC